MRASVADCLASRNHGLTPNPPSSPCEAIRANGNRNAHLIRQCSPDSGSRIDCVALPLNRTPDPVEDAVLRSQTTNAIGAEWIWQGCGYAGGCVYGVNARARSFISYHVQSATV